MPRNTDKTKNTHGISVKWKLFAYLAVFTAFMLSVVWIFQVVLLDRFYEKTKLSELNAAANALSASVANTETLKATAEEFSADYQMSVLVFDSERGRIVDCRAGDALFINTAAGESLNSLYREAKCNGGVYVERRTVSLTRRIADIKAEAGGDEANGGTYTDERKQILYVKIVETEQNEFIIMLNMSYTPLDSTVNTLKLQFFWIFTILLGGALMLTALLSANIAIPLVKMNASARKLAQGDYNAAFPAEGYRETRELAQTLNYAASELSKTDNLQKELIANISHDLRTPLTMITGYSEVMRDIPGENTPENVQVIIDEAERLAELVNDLLDLSKIQSGTVRFEKEVFNLTETVRATLERYRKLTGHDGFTIEFKADGDISVNADRTRILQVVYNLINNALNYSGEEKLVRVVQTVNGGRVRIAVVDRGEGIEPENLAQIWDRYYKVDRVHKRAVVGTGLGLSIVKGILELHNAAYGVESTVGQGSTFWFELDVVRDY